MRRAAQDPGNSIGRVGLSPVDPDDAAFFDRERQPAVFQRQSGFAEQFAAPAMERGDVGLVVGGDLVEIVDGGDHLAGDGVALRRHPQQHFEEFDGRSPIGIAARLFDLRQRVGIAGKAALHGGDVAAVAAFSIRRRMM